MKNLRSITILLCTIMLCLFQQSYASTQPEKTAAKPGEQSSTAIKSGKFKNNQTTLLETAIMTPIDSVAACTKKNQQVSTQECAAAKADTGSNGRVCKTTVAQTQAYAANDNGIDQSKILWQFDAGG